MATKTPPDALAQDRRSQSPHIVGFIDFGCAFAHPQFRHCDPDGRASPATRIFALWDQEGTPEANQAAARNLGFRPLAWTTPELFGYGAEVLRDLAPHGDEMSALGLGNFVGQFTVGGHIDERQCYSASGYAAINAPSTHGTHTMDVAVGYPDPQWPLGEKLAKPSNEDIVFVQLPRHLSGRQTAGLLRSHVLDAVRYILGCAQDDAAVTINLSYGSNAGPHDGSSLLELALDDAIERRQPPEKTRIVIPAGNSRDQQMHARTEVPGGDAVRSIVWENIPANPTDQFVEIWLDTKGPTEACMIRVTEPHERWADPDAGWIRCGQEARIEEDGTLVAMVVAPVRACQSPNGRMVLLAVAPTMRVGDRAAAPFGAWTIEIRNTGAQPVEVNAWCERNDAVFGTNGGSRQARFINAEPSMTLNSIAHGRLTTIVGGLVGDSGGEAIYSGRGPGRGDPRSRYLCEPGEQAKPGPDRFAFSDESQTYPGIAAATVFGTGIRLRGTSVSAAVATRELVRELAGMPPDTAS